MRATLTAGRAITHDDGPLLSRRQVVESCHRQLERQSHPRLLMTLLIVLTAGVGWLASSILLAWGMESMWLRYPVAVTIAYGAFLFLLWLWLRRRDLDVPDVCVDTTAHTGSSCGRCPDFEAGGGQFGGGGASGSFDGTSSGAAGCGVDGGAGDWGAADVLGAADELAVPIVVLVAAIALVLGLAFASVYVVYTAPSLLAELTVDAALSYAVARRLEHGQQRMWLGTAIARTGWPALCTATFLAVVGAVLAIWAPETTSLVAALRQLLGG